MATIPSLEKLLNETENIPNSILEESYKEIALHNGIRRYGRIKEIPEIVEIDTEEGKKTIPFRKEVLRYIREAINGRNREGHYYFKNKTERVKLHRINLNPAF